MSDSTASEIESILRQADRLPFGEVKIGLLDEAVRLADSIQDLDVMFLARMRMIRDAPFSGQSEKGVIAYPWCLAHFRRDPARFARHKDKLLWFFKAVLRSAAESLQVPSDQTDALFEQMAQTYREFGFNLRPVYHVRFKLALGCGDCEAASKWLALQQAETRDRMADCEACEDDALADYYELVGELEKCIEIMKPNLNGVRRCAVVPHRTFTNVLRPLAILGRYEEADRYQRRGYQLIRHNPAFISWVGAHMAYLAHRKRLPPAIRMLERHLIWALRTFELDSRYYFYLTVGRVLRTLAEAKTTCNLNLPREFPAFELSGIYDLQTLIAWFRQQETDLAARFDRRNENAFFSKSLPERMNY